MQSALQTLEILQRIFRFSAWALCHARQDDGKQQRDDWRSEAEGPLFRKASKEQSQSKSTPNVHRKPGATCEGFAPPCKEYTSIVPRNLKDDVTVPSSLDFSWLEARLRSTKSSANCDSSKGVNFLPCLARIKDSSTIPDMVGTSRKTSKATFAIRCRNREAGPPTAASKLRSQENPIKIPKEVMRARLREADFAPGLLQVVTSSSPEVTPSLAQAVSTRRLPGKTLVVCIRPLQSCKKRLIIREFHVGKLVQHLY